MRTDIEVHFSLNGQIHRQIKDLPEGTPVTGLHLTLPDGTAIETEDRGTTTMSFGKLKRVTKEFALGEKVAKAILSLEVWLDRKEIAIPVKVKAGVGL